MQECLYRILTYDCIHIQPPTNSCIKLMHSYTDDIDISSRMDAIENTVKLYKVFQPRIVYKRPLLLFRIYGSIISTSVFVCFMKQSF